MGVIFFCFFSHFFFQDGTSNAAVWALVVLTPDFKKNRHFEIRKVDV